MKQLKRLTIKNLPELPATTTEELNQLRISLGFAGADIKTVMVTSSIPNEGKSFVAMNLWAMMARVGVRVLLIDCDLRNSSMRAHYGLTTEEDMVGMVHYLSGKAEMEDVVYQTDIGTGYIIPVVKNIIDPTILLEDERFSRLMKEVRDCGAFDMVIVDTPPLGSVADALHIASYCDGTLLVVRSGSTPRKLAQNSQALIARTGTPLVGIVLNRADEDRHGYGRSYYRRYYSHYGYGYGKYYGDKSGKADAKQTGWKLLRPKQ